MINKIVINTTITIFLWFVLIVSISSVCYVKAAETVPSINVVTIDYPPLLGRQGTIMTDIATAAFDAIGITVNYEVYPLARVVRAVTENSTNTVAAALGSRNWFHKNKDPNSVYFISLYWLNMHLFYLKSKFPDGLTYEKLSDLQKYKIGYIRGGALIPIFDNANITPELVTTISQNVKKVYNGRDDMFAATELGGWAIINRHYPDHVDDFASSAKPIHHISADVIFAEDQRDLSEKFKLGLRVIKRNGTYLKIVKNYYGNRQVPDYILEIIAQP